MLKNISSIIKSYSVELLLLLTLLPLLFLHLPLALDWGDDFAGYLLQALHHQKTGLKPDIQNYLYNKDYFIYAPDRYPPVYSFLLYLWGKIAPHGLSNYLLLNALIVLLWSYTIFHFTKAENNLSAFLAAILVAYNPFVIEMKNELLSDFLFCQLVLLSILSHIQKQRKFIFLFISGFAACLAFLTKSLGIFLPISFAFAMLFDEKRFKNLIGYFWGYISALSLALIIFEWKEFQNLLFFSRIAQHISTIDVIKDNLNIYTELIKYYPANFSSQYHFLIKWIYSIVFTMGLIGALLSIKKINQPKYVYFWVLFSLILIFPNSRQGLRYLLPLMPFFVLLVFDGFRLAFASTPKLKIFFKLSITAALIVILYKPTLVLCSTNKIDESELLQNNATTKPLLLFLKNEVAADEVICFKKARAIVLYTNKKCFANNIEHNLEQIQKEMSDFKPKYFITGNLDVLHNHALEKFISYNQHSLDTVFSNSNYNVLKWRNQ